MTRSLAILSLVTLALAAGCESTPHYNRTKAVLLGTPGPARPHGSVRLYEGKEAVGAPYEVISMLSVEGHAGEEAAFIKAFLYRAADVGADGLILYRGPVAAGVQGGGFVITRNGGFGGASQVTQDAVFRGEAIRVTK